MKTMSKYIVSIVLLFSVSCNVDNFLDETPQINLSESFLNENLAVCQQYIVSVYGGRVEGKYLNERYIDMLPTPYVVKRDMEISRHTLTSEDQTVLAFWRQNYEYHNRATVLLRGLYNLTDTTKDDKGYIIRDRLKGEAKFLRALRDYQLVKAFGNVPLPSVPITMTNIKEDAPQLTQEEGFQFIANDLRDAAYGDEKLPTKDEWPAEQLGRATRDAAKTLLAKVYIELGEYGNARIVANEVINSGIYDLYSNKYGDWSNYYDIFRQKQENGPGSIFEWQQAVAEDHLMATEYNRDMSPTVTTKLAVYGYDGARVPSVLWDTISVNGDEVVLMQDTLKWGDIVPADSVPANQRSGIDWTEGSGLMGALSSYLIEQFRQPDLTYDPRKFVTVMENGSWYPGFGLVWIMTDVYSGWLGKNIGTREDKWNNIGWWFGKNVMVFRYADLLLTYAEATALTGDNLDDAIDKINMVRARVSVTPRPAGASQAQVLEWVRKERILELFGEGGSFYDLQRYAKHHPGWTWASIMDHEDEESSPFDPAKHSLYPIPQYEIDIAGYKQNPGY